MLPRPTGVAGDVFQALVEHSSDAIALLDAHGIIRFSSRSAERILGYTPEERQGRSAFDFVEPSDVPALREALARIASSTPGIPMTREIQVRHKNGSWRRLEVVAVNRLPDPAVAAIVVNYRDVTDRKRAEDALRASEARLRHLFETAADIIYDMNPQGRFTYVNPTIARVMKYAESELIGRHYLSLIRSDFQATVKAFYARQTAERTPNTYLEFPAVTKDGETVWLGQHVQLVFSGGELAGAQAICRDISRQKEAEDRLRRSEARYRSLIQGAAHGLFRATLDGQFLDANPAFAAMLGYESVEDLKKVDMATAYQTPDQAGIVIERHWRAPGETLSGDYAWRKRDGTPIVVRLTARLVESGEPQGEWSHALEGIAEDITHNRALEEQLRQSQKMEAVGRLARGIAHDFNNVLAAILGCADLLQLRLAPDDPRMVDAREIARAAERGAELTRQLLVFSRRQAVEPQVLDVHGVLRGFDTMLQRIAGEIALRLHTPGPPPRVRIEPGQLEQVVMNLVLNARDASSSDGVIDVTGDVVTFDARNAPGLPPGRYARIAVHDLGAGIDPELQRLVFEPFFTTKDPSKGNGLGLSIVYGIAKDAGGTVTFCSPPGQGTTFEVFLPVTDAPA